ncbi:MAG: hypothetical protein GXO08_03040 [Aquificae bacterium]|nr:hypothetical protein [Aquificota bacterium]
MAVSLEFDIDRLLYLHQISRKDRERVRFLGRYLREHKDEFLNLVTDALHRFPELKEILTPSFLEEFRRDLSQWFDRLFEANYNAAYLHYLTTVGEKFVSYGFSPHHIIVLMDFIRNYFNTKIFDKIRETQDPEEIEKYRAALKSLNKVLDLNLDIVISHYVDVETRKLLQLGKFGRAVVAVAAKFGLVLDTAILVGLVLLAFFIVYLFVNDLLHIFEGNMAHGVIAALGDLLILWTILELLNSQIKFMLGGEFAISSFVSVALAATIREALIATLEPTKPVEFKVTLALIILVLGIVFGIVKWFEIKGAKKRVLPKV